METSGPSARLEKRRAEILAEARRRRLRCALRHGRGQAVVARRQCAARLTLDMGRTL